MAAARKASTSKTTGKKTKAVTPKTSSKNGKIRSGKPAALTSEASPNARKTALPKGKPATNGQAETGQAKPVLNQKEMLRQERAQVESELAALRAEMQEAPEMTGDEVDLNVYEREKTLGLVAAYERRLEEIDRTLQVAAQGKYGICERCGNPIDPERLKIFPETRLCVSCKNIVEQEQRRLRMG
jgi:RNA polymerase-binding protein DksA